MTTLRMVVARAAIAHEVSKVIIQENLDGVVTYHYADSRSAGSVLDMAATMIAVRRISEYRGANPDLRVEILTMPSVIEAVENFRASQEVDPVLWGVTKGLVRILDLYRLHGEPSTGSLNRKEKRSALDVVLQDATVLEADLWDDLCEEAAQAGIPQAEAKLAAQDAWSLPEEDQRWVKKNKATIVYTDGSARAKEKFSSWAWWVDEARHGSGTLPRGDSFMAEKMAINEAIRSIEGPVLVVSDQVQVKKMRGVMSPQAHHIFHDNNALTSEDRVRVVHVMGHQHCPGNLAVDALAGKAYVEGWSLLQNDKVRLAQHERECRIEEENLRQERDDRSEAWRAAYAARERERTLVHAQRRADYDSVSA